MAFGRWKGSRSGRDVAHTPGLVIYCMSFVAMAVSLASVAWVTGDVFQHGLLVALAAVGYLVSGRDMGRRLRLTLLIYPLAILAGWFMRDELLAIAVGGSLFPLAKFLGLVQVLVSFNLQSLRTLYDALILSLAILLLASVDALSAAFGLFFVAFSLSAAGFLVAAHVSSWRFRIRLVAPPKSGHLALAGTVVMLLALGASAGIFLALPQRVRIQAVSPLPSRLDLTTRQVVPPQDLLPGDEKPLAEFLPSHSTDVGPTPGPEERKASGAPTSPRAKRGVRAGPLPEPVAYATLGYAGEAGDDVVMRVRSTLSSYWRGRVLDEYDGKGWFASNSRPQALVTYEGRVVFADTPQLSWTTDAYVQTFFLRTPQPYAVFTGYSPGVVTLGGSEDPFSSDILAALAQPGVYRVVSAVPRLTPGELEVDSADVGSLAAAGPILVPPQVRELAQSIVAGSKSDYERAARLERFLLENYEYDLRAQPLPSSGDAVESLLFERTAGYCAQFATAMAVMARTVGLPARVATGYLPGSYDSLAGVHVVRLKDAHAWVEINFKRSGWVPFDPTPRPDSPFGFSKGSLQQTRSLQQIMRHGVRGALIDGPSTALNGVASFFGDDSPVKKVAAASVPLLSSVVLGVALMNRARRSRTHEPPASAGGFEGARAEMARLYRRSLVAMRRKGYPERQLHQTPGEYIEALRAMGLRVPEPFEQLSLRAGDAFYNPRPFPHADVESARRLLGELRRVRRLS